MLRDYLECLNLERIVKLGVPTVTKFLERGEFSEEEKTILLGIANGRSIAEIARTDLGKTSNEAKGIYQSAKSRLEKIWDASEEKAKAVAERKRLQEIKAQADREREARELAARSEREKNKAQRLLDFPNNVFFKVFGEPSKRDISCQKDEFGQSKWFAHYVWDTAGGKFAFAVDSDNKVCGRYIYYLKDYVLRIEPEEVSKITWCFYEYLQQSATVADISIHKRDGGRVDIKKLIPWEEDKSVLD